MFGFAGICCVVACAVWPGLFDFKNPVLRIFGRMIIVLIVGAFFARFTDIRVPKEFRD